MSIDKNLKTARTALSNIVAKFSTAGHYDQAERVLRILQDLGAVSEPINRVAGPVIIDGLNAAERKHVANGEKIFAIKEHRARTGFGLKESKDIVEDYSARNPDKVGVYKPTLGDVYHPGGQSQSAYRNEG